MKCAASPCASPATYTCDTGAPPTCERHRNVACCFPLATVNLTEHLLDATMQVLLGYGHIDFFTWYTSETGRTFSKEFKINAITTNAGNAEAFWEQIMLLAQEKLVAIRGAR